MDIVTVANQMAERASEYHQFFIILGVGIALYIFTYWRKSRSNKRK